MWICSQLYPQFRAVVKMLESVPITFRTVL